MKTTFLEFEQPVAELEARIDELRFAQEDSAADISDEIQRLAKKSQALTKDIYAKLTPWQVAQVARHPQRPYTLDYVSQLFTGFEELHGDRTFSDDLSIVGGLARFGGEACMVIGHQKGRDTKEKIKVLQREARQAVTLADQHRIQEEIQKLEKVKRRQRQDIFKAEDDIIEKRDSLIESLEKRLAQRTNSDTLFTIRWSVD